MSLACGLLFWVNTNERRITFVSMHTSPVAEPGTPDAGGMNVVELNWALSLAQLGYGVDLVTRRDGPSADCVEIADDVRLFNLPVGPKHPVAKSEQEQFIDEFSLALKDWLAGPGSNTGLIHSQHWFSGVAALPVAKEAGIAHVQSFHSVAAPADTMDPAAGEKAESPGRIEGERMTANESDLIVTVSEAEKRTIIERYGVSPDSIAVVHPGVDLELFRPLSCRERHWNWSGCYVVFAARLEPLKGADLAIKALAEMTDKPRLVIAGQAASEFADYEDQLQDLAIEKGVADEVIFLGTQKREELARMIRGACVLLNPSYSETFGLINLEAAASGVPVIASRAGGLEESVADGLSGILLDNRNPKNWAQAIKKFTGSARTRAQYAKSAREFAERNSWADSAERLAVTYNQIKARRDND